MTFEAIGSIRKVPGVFGSDGHRLLDQNVSAGFEGRFRVFVMEPSGTGHEAYVDARVQHVAIVLAGDFEAPIGLDLLEELRTLSRDRHELHVIATRGKFREV